MRNIFGVQPTLDNPGAYPLSAWSDQAAKYFTYFYHFDGDLFDEQVSGSEIYPLKLNIFNLAAMMHCGFLFGEVPDGSDPLVKTVIEPWGNSAAENFDKGRKLAEIVNMTWYENDGRDLQQENGILSQVAGGCYFDIAYDESRLEEGFTIPIRLGQTMPYYVFPVWAGNDHRRMLETIVTFYISSLQAQELGVTVREGDISEVVYQEHWKRTGSSLTADGQPIKYPGYQAGMAPLGGVLPYVYVPHVRVGEFYGVSLFEDKDELAKEVNARWADLGDVVADNAKKMPYIWNSQHPTIRRLARTVPVVDLGQQIPGMTTTPGVQFPTSTGTDTGSVQHANNLLTLARTQAYTPDVVYGLDEGSQRSFLTLAVRMIPLIVHIRQERTHWTSGLNSMARKILRYCAIKGIEGVTEADLRHIKIHQDWAPILPRDREVELNEIILRLNNNLIPLETALEKLGDISDIKTSMNLIKEWMEYQAEVEAKAQPQNPFGNSGSRGEQAGMKRPSQPQANISKEEK